MSRRKKQGLSRLWQLVTLLDGTKRGRTVAELADRMEVSQPTLYRYLDDLRQAGVGVDRRVVTGETRYRLLGTGIPPIVPTPKQLAALHFARQSLASLEGTEMVEQLDALLGRWKVLDQEPLPLSRQGRASKAPALLRTLEDGLRTGRRLALEYRGTKDSGPRKREVDAIGLHTDEDAVYLVAFDHGCGELRTFKVARIAAAELLLMPAGDHANLKVSDVFGRSVKVWHGDAVETLVVRLSAKVARYAREYPLMPSQQVEPLADGSALVRAEARGIQEALRWVLSWGAEAEAVAPQALREGVWREVEGARARYAAGPKVRGVKQAVAREVRGGGGR
ncbi:MAG: WYL domain-containing protein, partial [Polyangiaceae bacterium]|nr:WYL domain-containing protein [Polyangiaceae bacterium]